MEILSSQIEALYNDCGCTVEAVDRRKTQGILSMFTAMTVDMWQGNPTGQSFTGLILSIGSFLYAGVYKSFINYNATDHAALAFMRENIFAFSMAKSASEFKQLSQLLTNKNKIRKWADFKEEALKIHKTYNERWLSAEYDHAVATGQMTRIYQNVQQEKDVFPFLRWDAVRDDRTRPEHMRLDGITLRADDAFWRSYWPPIAWRCRCDVTQARSGRETPIGKAKERIKEAVPRKSIFFGNPAVKKTVFDADKHPYFSDQRLRNYRAVQDYGMKTPKQIYKKNYSFPSLKSHASKEAYDKWWFDEYQSRNGSQGKFIVKDKLNRPIAFDAQVRDHVSRYDVSPQIIEVLKQPDEVWSSLHKLDKRSNKVESIRYIKYYNEKPVQVVVVPDKDELRIKTFYGVEDLNNLNRHRKGILNFRA